MNDTTRPPPTPTVLEVIELGPMSPRGPNIPRARAEGPRVEPARRDLRLRCCGMITPMR